MLNFVRNHNKIIMAVLILLVFPSFVLFGISSYSSGNPGSAKVAQVDGQAITQTEWDSAVRRQADNARSSSPNVDMRLLDTPAFKYRVLEQIVSDRVLAAAATHERLTIADAQLAQALRQELTAAGLVNADGNVDMARYQQVAAAQGGTQVFEAGLRAQLSQQQVLAGVMQAVLADPALVDVALRAMQERREARVALFKPGDYSARLQPTDADLQAFYQAHVAQYQAPESARIEYVVLDLDSVKRRITVSDADLHTYYDQNAATLGGSPEERRASHILIDAPKGAPAADRAKAKVRAEELLAQLRKDPDRFAAIAQKDSQDSASAPQGGDLGYFSRDKGVDPSITHATFALAKTGDISGVVESDFGYHIVRLTGIKPATVPPFDQVRASLEDKFRTQQAQRQFSDLAENLINTAYEQSDSLKPAAEPLKLAIQTAEVTRPPAPDAQGVLANPKFLEALFSADAREKKNNTPALETGPYQLVTGRVVAYSPAHARPYATVKDAVRAAYLAERGAQLARQAGEQQLKTWQARPASATGLAGPVTLSRQDMQKQPVALVEAVLRANPDKLPVFIGVDLGAGGYAIAQVQKVLPWVAPDKTQAAQDLAGYQRLWGAAEASAYYDYLKQRYKAQILVPAPVFTAEPGSP